LWGAARGWANPEYADTKTAKATKAKAGKSKASKAKAGRSGAAPGSRWGGRLAGWNAGVPVARQRRTEGKDLWSIGSRFAGRTWGGGESLVVGARRLRADLGAWYRGRQYAADGPVVQGTVIDDEPETTTHTERDPASEGGEAHDGVRHMSPRDSDRYDLGVVHDIDFYGYDRERPRLVTACNRCADKKLAGDVEGLDPEFAREGTKYVFSSRVDFGTGGTWTCPVCGETYDPTTYPRPSKDLAAMVAAGGAPAEGAGAPSNTTNTTMPAFAGERMNLMSEMSIGELDNIGAVRAEAEAAGQLIAMLGESIAAAKAWADNLADRWAGADWGTGPLNAAVATVAEGGQALGTTELLEAGVVAFKLAVVFFIEMADMSCGCDF
ncbi:hypothetical protein ACFWC2_31255, partial [Streptomyces diastaticus]|uniref:hypothetical protein n=1 Tax=Streptomyces diastaticus TaxID=1956 RepID=UPI00365B1735